MRNWLRKPITTGTIVGWTGIGVLICLAEMAWLQDWPKKIKEKFSKKEDEKVEENSSDENTED